MCGIAGSINSIFDPAQTLSSMAHRGPDAKNSIVLDNVQLLHTRLSIIDSKDGAQPMRRGRFVVSYNGEIYNHLSLRVEHKLKCATQSDTETFLALFEMFSVECFKMLDGMFAIAIYDTESQRLLLVRDRAGEKPLYISQAGRKLYFASELNALGTMCSLEVDDSAVNDYLSTGLFFRSKTAYKNVFECPAGCYMDINTSTLESSCVRWFELGADADDSFRTLDEQAVVNEIDARLHESIRDRLLSSDVEVGAFLSGGIDSGLVTAIASEYTDSLKTFTVAFDGQFDESALAGLVSDQYGTDHHLLRVEYSKLDQNIETILHNYGEPICDDSVIPTWYVSRAAKQHVTVVLTGDGADELFGGYRRYVPYSRFDLFNHSGRSADLWNSLLRILPLPNNKMSNYNYGYRLIDLIARSGLDRYLSTTVNVNTLGLETNHRCADMERFHANLAESDTSSLSKLMTMDFHTILHGMLLPKMDIGSMAHSLESRSPFLSKDLLQLAPNLKDSDKIRGSTTKFALRQLAGKYLPESVQTAPKRGFETSLHDLVSDNLKTIIGDYLSSNNAYVRQFYKPGFIDGLLTNSLKMSSTQQAKTLWMIFCVEVWAAKT